MFLLSYATRSGAQRKTPEAFAPGVLLLANPRAASRGSQFRTGEPLRLGLVQQVIRRTYLIAPWLMLVAHLGFSHWAHRSPFTPADLTPLFLGLTIAATRGRLPHDALGLTRLLPAAAWIVSFSAPQTLEWDLPGGPTLHPAMVAAGAMFVTYGYLFSLTTAAVTLAAVSLAGAAYVWFMP